MRLYYKLSQLQQINNSEIVLVPDLSQAIVK